MTRAPRSLTQARETLSKRTSQAVDQEECDKGKSTRLLLRSGRVQCVRGKAADDASRSLGDNAVGYPKRNMGYFFLAKTGGEGRANSVLNCLDMRSGAVLSAVVTKGADE